MLNFVRDIKSKILNKLEHVDCKEIDSSHSVSQVEHCYDASCGTLGSRIELRCKHMEAEALQDLVKAEAKAAAAEAKVCFRIEQVNLQAEKSFCLNVGPWF